jgi:PKD repeat protein
MKKQSLLDQFAHSSKSIKIAAIAVVAVWGMVFVTLVAGAVLLLERPGLALQATPDVGIPAIVLNPTVAQEGSAVTIRGEAWDPGSMVLIYLTAPGETGAPSYATASAVADAEGRFNASFVVPSGPGWENQGTATVTAQVVGGGVSAHGFLSVMSSQQLAATTEVAVEPTATPTETVTPTPTSQPVEATATATPVIAATSTSTPTPTPTPTPVPVIVDWQGEYYANGNLAGTRALIRNDTAINFNWGAGSPASEVPADNFSARWSRTLAFDAGLYRFYAIVDDGVRLYVDDALVIDAWSDGSARQVSGEQWLSSGNHSLGVEYYEHAGDAVIQVWWEKVNTATSYYPDWKGEYWSNPDLSGSPALVRNDVAIDFDWGTGSAAAGLPADNFSARWTRTWTISDEGLYRFHLAADDGVRVWVDDALVIDQWWDGGREETADYWLDDGTYSLRLEYYEHTGEARILLWAEEVSEAPEADFDASPRSGVAPLEVEFDNDSSGDYDDCEWRFGDGDSDDDCDDASHTYWEAGEYTVKLMVSGPGGEDTKKRSEYITVYEPAQAHFRASPTSGVVPLSVNFTDLSSGDYDTCTWSLGDGATRAGCDDFSHTYATAGNYTVRLSHSGSGGSNTETKTNYITVSEEPQVNQPPEAVINGPTEGLVGEVLTFDGSSSSDTDGTILGYMWNFGDGATASGVTVSHSYATAGSYNVSLTVTDDDGLSDTSTYSLLIQESSTNQSPVAVVNGPTGALVGETVIFDSGGSYDADGTIVSYVWDFGDGGASALAQAGARSGDSTMAHVYNAPGTYQVTLTVTDDDGLSAMAWHTLVVQESGTNQPPVAVITGPAGGTVGEELAFDGRDSSDNDGSVVDYAWDYGDGTTGSGQRVNHSYAAPGSYQVTLTVTDDGGLSGTATHIVIIDQPANQPPVAVINGPTQGLVGEVLTFDSSSSSDPDGAILGYTWDFGDGATTSGGTVSHSYNTAGNYDVILTVTDDDGLSDTSTYTLFIAEGEPSPGPESPTPTPTPTATATNTSMPTETPTATPSAPEGLFGTPTATNTPVPPTDTPTATPTPESSTPTSTLTPTASAPVLDPVPVSGIGKGAGGTLTGTPSLAERATATSMPFPTPTALPNPVQLMKEEPPTPAMEPLDPTLEPPAAISD